MQGFIIFADYANRFDEFAIQMGKWVREGSVKFREDIVDGLEKAPQAFMGMLKGKNFGKVVVHIANGQFNMVGLSVHSTDRRFQIRGQQ